MHNQFVHISTNVCFASNLHLTQRLLQQLHQSHISPVGRRLMATESAKDAMRPFHKVAATGSSWMRYLKKGISSKVPTVSHAKGDRFKQKTSFFQDKFRPLPLQPFSSSTVSIFYPAFLHRTAGSVCLYLSICPSPTCLSWQWIG